MRCKNCKTRLNENEMICPNCHIDNTPPEGVNFFNKKQATVVIEQINLNNNEDLQEAESKNFAEPIVRDELFAYDQQSYRYLIDGKINWRHIKEFNPKLYYQRYLADALSYTFLLLFILFTPIPINTGFEGDYIFQGQLLLSVIFGNGFGLSFVRFVGGNTILFLSMYLGILVLIGVNFFFWKKRKEFKIFSFLLTPIFIIFIILGFYVVNVEVMISGYNTIFSLTNQFNNFHYIVVTVSISTVITLITVFHNEKFVDQIKIIDETIQKEENEAIAKINEDKDELS